MIGAIFGVGIVALLGGAAAVVTDTLGAGERFEALRERLELAIDPPPDRPIEDVVVYAPASPAPSAHVNPGSSVAPTVGPHTPPKRTKVDVDILGTRAVDPRTAFKSQLDKDWCSPAGVQMALAVVGLADTSDGFQTTLAGRVDEWESWRDSHNGNWGPSAMVQALTAYGASGYELRAYDRRADALRDAAAAITSTGSPVILLAWRGAHTWVVTGYRADADPLTFPDAKITGMYVLDPWYPRVSSIWGASDGPGVFQDAKEMERNFLPWKRPEGSYPGRDGRFIALIPTAPVGTAAPLTLELN